jgi:dTDP-4-dehydrorhamnose 3,5-epimerase-like enzyme
MTLPVLKARNCRWIDVPGASDARGRVNFLEPGKGLDFEPKRLFYLHHVAPGQWRGRHAHRHTQLVIIAVSGSCRTHLDDGTHKEAVTLDNPTKGLHIAPWVWHELTDFAAGTVVVVLASTPYDEADYLRDDAVFRREVGAQR